MSRKRKTESNGFSNGVNGAEDDSDFELGSLDDELSDDEQVEESGDEASSESGDNVEDELDDLEKEDDELPKSGTNGDADDTESEDLLSDLDSESYSSDSDVVIDADGNPRKLLPEIEPAYDSDSSAYSETNRIGNIDIEKYYGSMPHIGYDINGRRIMRPAAGAALDQLLDTIELPKGWTGVIDKETGQLKNLTDEELEIIKRIRREELPHDDIEIYDPYRFPKEDPFPLSAAPEPKRRFLPSKHEAIRIMKIVRAIRQGKIVKKPPPQPRSLTATYDIWSSDPIGGGDVKPPGTRHIPAPKLKLPEHDESYNPPPEYLPTEEEKKQWEELDEEDREKNYLPKKYPSLRLVPAWGEFIKERFERCLDLYLAPRVQKRRLNVDPESLIPKLPSPKDLRPFPTKIGVVYEGHTDKIRSVSVDPTGMWVATGSEDGSVRIWEVRTGREVWKWTYPNAGGDDRPYTMAWNPVKEVGVLAIAVGDTIYILIPPIWNENKAKETKETCDKGFYSEDGPGNNESSGVKWSRGKTDDVVLVVKTLHTIRHLTWHRRGDYFATVAPQGTRAKSILIHQLSRHQSQAPVSRSKGPSTEAIAFHPILPQIFIASRTAVSHHSLSPSKLIRKLRPGFKFISSLDVHPLGEHIIIGSYDKKVAWFDLNLDDKPYKTLRYHEKAVRDVLFHKGGVKLFATAGDEGAVQVFHANVGMDTSYDSQPVIVPLKVLKGHSIVESLGVLGIAWHPKLAWLVSAGADGKAILWT